MFRPTYRVTGHVVDEKGAPIAGVGFAAGAFGNLRTRDALERPIARSGADGRFAVDVPVSETDPRLPLPGFLCAAAGRVAIG